MATLSKHNKHFIIIVLSTLISISLYSQEKQTCSNCHSKLLNNTTIHAAAEDACENCHESSGRLHPAVNGNEFELVESVPGLCYMCHEAQNTKTNVHPPITDGYCWMCHDPHSSPNSYLLTKKPTSETCKKCHTLEIPKTDKIHSPVKKGECNKCHDPHQSDNTSFLKEKKPQLCFTCHENVQKEADFENIHYPFDDDCSNCHNSHSSSENFLMSEKTPTLCFNCHDGIQESIKGAVSSHSILLDEKNCANCHSPHASSYTSLLKKEGKEMCLSCHSKAIKTEMKSVKNIGGGMKNAKSVHAAIEMDGCATCHKAHFSDQKDLLNQGYPSKNYAVAETENFALCFECHDSELLEKEFTTSATNFRTAEKNMHFIHINGKKGRTCSLCHDVHSSANEHLINEKSKFGSWEMLMNYKVTSAGGSCFPGCHGEESYKR